MPISVLTLSHKRPSFRPPFQAHDLPVDILPPILFHLNDRKDWHTCTLVSKTFSRVATPFLYHTLDSRVISKTWVHHPCTTLLARPELARYVRRVTETGAVHRGMHVRYPNITQDALSALALCTNLQSMTWIDDVSSRTSTSEKLLAFIATIRPLPVRELTIRTHTDLGEQVWSELITLTGLHKVSIWCMEGPPRVLQGWSGSLGSTLTHLELGVSAFLYPCSELLAQLPLLQDLRLKGAPATAIPTILTFLPDLKTLDTEYLLSGSGTYHFNANLRARSRTLQVQQARARIKARTVRESDYGNTNGNDDDDDDTGSDSEDSDSVSLSPPVPTLRRLTVRTSSMDNLGPQQLWSWIRDLIPLPGLQSFRLHAFAFAFFPFASHFSIGSSPHYSSSSTSSSHDLNHTHTHSRVLQGVPAMRGTGGIDIPRSFILEMAKVHGRSLTEFDVGEASLTLGDIECLANKLERLEVLVCALASPDVASIIEAISPAKNMHTLKLQVTWIPMLSGSDDGFSSDDDDDDDDRQNQSQSRTRTRTGSESKSKSKSRKQSDTRPKFTEGDARRMMIGLGADSDASASGSTSTPNLNRESKSKLRVISVGGVLYTGKWVLKEGQLDFVVSADVAEDKWRT